MAAWVFECCDCLSDYLVVVFAVGWLGGVF